MKAHDFIEAVESRGENIPLAISCNPVVERGMNSPASSPSPKANKTLAQLIDSCSEFYAFYGMLDGLSVSYSTLKFFCEIFTSSSKEYGEVLKMILFEPRWVFIVSVCTAFIAGLSLMANYLEKYKTPQVDKHEQPHSWLQCSYIYIQQLWHQFCIFLKDHNIVHSWEYVRNLLKGIKNGFKGTKSFIALFLTLGLMDKNFFKSIYFPISINIGIICMVNRAWNITMKLTRKKLSAKCDESIDKIKSLNKFLEDKQAYKSRLRSLSHRSMQIEKLEYLAKRLDIKSFNEDTNYQISSVEREIKQTTGLSGSRSSMNFNQTQVKTIDRGFIENQLRDLLTSPELSDQQDIINALQLAIIEEERKGNLPSDYLKTKHPLVEKLVKEQKRLTKLREEVDGDKIYTPQELKQRYEQKKLELAKCIDKRKALDKEALNDLLNEATNLDKFWLEFDKMLQTLSSAEMNSYESKKALFSFKLEGFHLELMRYKKALSITLDTKEKEQINKQLRENEQAIYQLLVDHDFMDALGAQLIFNQLERDSETLNKYCRSVQTQFLFSNIIAGIIDAPYLYIGIMSLAVFTSSTILLALTVSVIAFILISVFFRAYEEVESNDACKLKQLKIKIALCDNRWKLAQNQYYKAYEKFKLENNTSLIDGTTYADKFLEETAQAEIIPALIDTYNASQNSRAALKSFIKPTLYSAVMHGAKDALSFYGAIASCFYALNILLLICGATFPPALIISAVCAGLVALIGFVSLRIYMTLNIQKDLTQRFQINTTSEKDFCHDKPSLPLGWADSNTDGLTRGEMFFQDLHEVVRCVCAGLGGKAINLSDFLFSYFKEGDDGSNKSVSIILLSLTLLLSLTYGVVLATRAFAKGFKKFTNKTNDKPLLITPYKSAEQATDSSEKVESNQFTLYSDELPVINEQEVDDLNNCLVEDNEQNTSGFCLYSFFIHSPGYREQDRVMSNSPSIFNQSSVA